MALPDFFVIGAPKAGTTALHVALARHPGLFLSPVKEPKFFLTDGPPRTKAGPGAEHSNSTYVWRREQYEQLFAGAAPGALRGESTTLYLSDMEAHRRLHDLVPSARLIAVLRDPVDRAHSNWTHNRSVGLERERDFLAACALEEERHRLGWSPMWSYLRLGRYGEQIQSLLRYFPMEQLLLLRYSDLCDEPERSVERVCEFLDVDRDLVRALPAANVTADVSDSPLNETLRRVMRRGASLAYKLPGRAPEAIGRYVGTPTLRLLHRKQKTRRAVTPEERRALIPEFTSDIGLLQGLTGLSFTDWLDPDTSSARLEPHGHVQVGATFDSIDRPVVDKVR